jgi:hypothetical protein
MPVGERLEGGMYGSNQHHTVNYGCGKAGWIGFAYSQRKIDWHVVQGINSDGFRR